MSLRYVLVLIVVAAAVGGSIVYVALREPARPTAVDPPAVWGDMPAPVQDTPNTSKDYEKRPEK